MRATFLLLFFNFSLLAEYGWLEEVVGIDLKEFDYKEGSDKELELYTKKTFFTDIKMSPNGKYLAFQSDSENFTQGILVVDLPYQEKEILECYKKNNLEFIQLIAPTSKNKTISECIKNDPSLIYYITQRGVTGLNNIDFGEVILKLKNIRTITDTPMITGFGIRKPDQVRRFKEYTDGIVVGSFLIEKFLSSDPLREISNSIKPLIDELKNE